MPTYFGCNASRAASAALAEWMDAHSDSLFLSVVKVAGIEAGIAKLRREGATRKSADLAAYLAAYLETVLHLYGNRIPVFDTRQRGLPAP
jgi:toxin FitB